MGLNLDLKQMLNLPETVTCPKCGAEVCTWMDDFDIEEPECNPEPGILIRYLECDCGADFQAVFEVKSTVKAVINEYFRFGKTISISPQTDTSELSENRD